MKLDAKVNARIKALVEKGEVILRPNEQWPWNERYGEWQAQALAGLTQVFGPTHTYSKRFASITEKNWQRDGAEAGVGILRAALEDLEYGHLDTIQQMAAAEVFSDFMEQAEHLLENGYSMPAASLAGAVLENGLRSLAARNDIAVNERDNLSALNNKIGDKGVYDRLRQKQVAVWTEVRDNADHGHFDRVKEGDVTDLINGVRGFLADYL